MNTPKAFITSTGGGLRSEDPHFVPLTKGLVKLTKKGRRRTEYLSQEGNKLLAMSGTLVTVSSGTHVIANSGSVVLEYEGAVVEAHRGARVVRPRLVEDTNSANGYSIKFAESTPVSVALSHQSKTQPGKRDAVARLDSKFCIFTLLAGKAVALSGSVVIAMPEAEVIANSGSLVLACPGAKVTPRKGSHVEHLSVTVASLGALPPPK
jgi:hypothetical protein